MRKITAIVVICVVLALIIFDVVAVSVGGSQATISDVVLDIALKRPAIPFAVGFVAGHLFWPQIRIDGDG